VDCETLGLKSLH